MRPGEETAPAGNRPASKGQWRQCTGKPRLGLINRWERAVEDSGPSFDKQATSIAVGRLPGGGVRSCTRSPRQSEVRGGGQKAGGTAQPFGRFNSESLNLPTGNSARNSARWSAKISKNAGSGNFFSGRFLDHLRPIRSALGLNLCPFLEQRIQQNIDSSHYINWLQFAIHFDPVQGRFRFDCIGVKV